MIGRRRQSTHPYQQNVSPERKKSSNNIGSAFGRFRQSHQQIGDQHLSPPPTGRTLSSDGPENPHISHEPPSNLERIASYTSERTNGTPLQSVAETNGSTGLTNGASGSHPALLEPMVPSAPTSSSEPPKDAEGFSLPSSSIDPIQQAMNEAADANIAANYKVNIKNAPIQEDSGDASAAMADVANALQMVSDMMYVTIFKLMRLPDRNSTKSCNEPWQTESKHNASPWKCSNSGNSKRSITLGPTT